MNEERTKIMEEILSIFGMDNLKLMSLINSGENLMDFLKENSVIYPYEYDGLLIGKVENFGEFSDRLNQITLLIRRKQKVYNLYVKYCECFLGETASYIDLTTKNDESYKQYGHLDLRDEIGKIDYAPYLAQLGINNLYDLNCGPTKVLKNN